MSRTPFAPVPTADTYWLVNGRIPQTLLAPDSPPLPVISKLAAAPLQEALVPADIEIRDGRVGAIVPAGESPATAPRCDLHQGLVWPCFVDMHTHLDKAHTWPRNPNPFGTFAEALEQLNVDREQYWRPEDLRRRMDFALRCSYAHGTRAVRTHIDCLDDQAETSFAVVEQLRQDWAGKIEIQHVSLVPIEFFLQEQAPADLAALVAKSGGIMGAVTYPHPRLGEQVDRIFRLAQEFDLPLDLHVDESLDAAAQALDKIAQTKLRYDFQGPVVCGHVCSLSIQSPEAVEATLKRVKQADIQIVSLPMCNLYLQHRRPQQTPRYRGVTLLHEMKQHGIPVALASDNCRDAFFAYGDHDGLEVFTESVRIAHLDCPYGDWPQTVTAAPATMMGLAESGYIQSGETADLVIFRARSLNELVARRQCDRIVLRQGKAIDTNPPDYAELDDLVYS